jgi:hypothetical protein
MLTSVSNGKVAIGVMFVSFEKNVFGRVGRVVHLTTLSSGCVQLTYSTNEQARQAIDTYHNCSLDGQEMYVSLQSSATRTNRPPSTNNEKRQVTANSAFVDLCVLFARRSSDERPTNNIEIDPALMRHALFNTSTSRPSAVRFQVTLTDPC